MHNSGLQKYYFKQKNEFETYYKKLLSHKNIDDIHKLRLAIKKLRTLLMLIELTTKESIDKKRPYHLYSKLFKSAGRVRETQINIELLRKAGVKDNAAIYPFYNDKLDTDLKHFHNELSNFNHKQFYELHKRLEKKIGDISASDFQRIVVDMLKIELHQILKLIGNLSNSTDLHKIRIRTRVLKELIILLKKINPNDQSATFLKNLKNTYIYLGDWHDHEVLTKSLNSVHSQKKKGIEIGELDQITKIFHKKEMELRKRSRDTLRKQLKSFKQLRGETIKFNIRDVR